METSTGRAAAMNQEQSNSREVTNVSTPSLRRVVLAEALTHPATLVPWVAGILGGLGWLFFGSPAMLAAAFGAGLLGIAGFTVNFFFRDKAIAERYFDALKTRMSEQEGRLRTNLRQDLEACAGIIDAEDLAKQGLEQFDSIQQKYQNLNRLLEEKLGSGELNLGGISAATEQLYLGVLDNLRDAVSTMRSISNMNEGQTYSRLKILARKKIPDQAGTREIDALKKRIRLREEQIQKVAGLLAQNEEALTQIDEVAAAVATIQSENGLAEVDPETAMERLRQLAEKVRT